MMEGLKFLILAIVVVSVAYATDYCNVKCWSNEPHTMCQHPSPGYGNACQEVKAAGLNQKLKRKLLNLHNRHRAFVASGREQRGAPGPQPAGRIPPLKWDEELARVAQRWANQCEIDHDRCRDVDRFKVNQNLAWNKWTDRYRPNLTDFVQGWYDEVKDFDSRVVPRYASHYGAVTTHYSTLVWGKATHVGCGLIKYKEGEWFVSYLVCNYGPMTNMLAEPVYERV